MIFFVLSKCHSYALRAIVPNNLFHKNSRFFHVAGMTVTFDISKEPGERVLSVMVGDEELDPDAEYTLATIDFIAMGGDENPPSWIMKPNIWGTTRCPSCTTLWDWRTSMSP